MQRQCLCPKTAVLILVQMKEHVIRELFMVVDEMVEIFPISSKSKAKHTLLRKRPSVLKRHEECLFLNLNWDYLTHLIYRIQTIDFLKCAKFRVAVFEIETVVH